MVRVYIHTADGDDVYRNSGGRERLLTQHRPSKHILPSHRLSRTTRSHSCHDLQLTTMNHNQLLHDVTNKIQQKQQRTNIVQPRE